MLCAQVVCRYYGVTSLSMRAAVSAQLVIEPSLREQLWFPETYSDNIHPTCLGMRWGLAAAAVAGCGLHSQAVRQTRMCRLMADQTIAFFQDLAAAMVKDRRAEVRRPVAATVRTQAPPSLARCSSLAACQHQCAGP